MTQRLKPLAPMLRALPGATFVRGGWLIAELAGRLRVVIGPRRLGDNEIARVTSGMGVRAVQSRSATTGRCGVVVATQGKVGLDIETTARIAQNVTPEDDWLARPEADLVGRAANPLIELACHWVLKEAYGKALGVGLALPLGDLSFGRQGRRIVLVRHEAALPGWRFGLYRERDAILGVAHRRV